MYDAVMAETMHVAGDGGDEIEAYSARPLAPGPFGGVVVIHHMPGYDPATKEITRRFATLGYLAVCPNLHYREAPGESPDDAAAAVRAAGGVPDDRLVGDVEGAARFLRTLSSSNGKVGVIGYCSGGRQSFLSACRLTLDAAVVCYGAFILDRPPADLSMQVEPLVGLVDRLSCPVLGLFGADDSHPAPDETARLDQELEEHGKVHEFHTYEGAGHGFFAVDRPSYRPEAAVHGWERIAGFFGRLLAS